MLDSLDSYHNLETQVVEDCFIGVIAQESNVLLMVIHHYIRFERIQQFSRREL